ncbi:SRPBCC domain-containing protein [Bacillus spizizenii]|uniref:SRPBCC family protein n=1 Tax=Bacillus spizizenii TaxID=96241 RepID=UPI0005C9F4F8|nr:SRPBCC domain-containing protein [Bacillus spizizenii]MCY7763422.1 SRPBCC domain-containing protein [Bacillus spizizenii]MCY7808565.1 SRPBCC domain-containing protein [Bacillus spizizenii]MCY7823010.1 SRPBCC domain-containing protein [Bacillus spizizenii]MCY7922591.1 SRPBCC domain-containing protein [Bacillus spizizenii]MCY8043664.1 SRPBCC domain-containing protein [Bacillus spizizenii]
MDQNRENTLPDITKNIILEAPIQKVWETVSTSEGIAKWFMPNDFQLKEGQEFTLQSPFGPSPCKVLTVQVPTELSFEWDIDGWVVTFQLEDLGEKTRFTLIHGGWKEPNKVIGKANEKSSIIHDKMDGGWTGIVNERLRKTVEE